MLNSIWELWGSRHNMPGLPQSRSSLLMEILSYVLFLGLCLTLVLLFRQRRRVRELKEKLSFQRMASESSDRALADSEERFRLALQDAYAAEQKLKSLINSLPIFIWSVDKDGICDLIEGHALSKLGLKGGQLVGIDYARYFQEGDAAFDNFQRALAGECFSTMRETKNAVFEIHYSPLYDRDRKQSGVVGIGVDVTASHEAQKERELFTIREKAMLEASRLKSEFLANMSHEIRTPLSGVIGMCRLLRETELTEEQRPMVDAVTICSDSLLALVNDVLDISKVEAGKLLLEKVAFNLRESLEQIRTIVEIKAKEKQLALIFEKEDHIPERVVGDQYRFQQILTNVLSNAIKFTERGTVRLYCSAREDEEGYVLEIDISDTGIGMSRSQTQLIFQYFSQADESTTRRFGGTGLGLSIAKNLCEAMGGGITVDSEEGVGSHFKIELRLARIERDRRVIQEPVFSLSRGREPRDLRILVAEDNEINAFLLKSYLQRMGYESHGVKDGELLLKCLDNADYDVIMMDVHMPKIDGIMATRIIREHSDSPHTPYIIAITASALLEDKEACMEAGMNDFLSKPITLDNLTRALDRMNALKLKELQDAPIEIFDEFEGDAEIFQELTHIFKGQRREFELEISEALDTSDFDRLFHVSHKLRGSLSPFSSRLATPWAEALERAARDEDIEAARSSFQSLKPEMEELGRLMDARVQHT